MMVAETFDEISALFERTGPAVGKAVAGGFDYTRVIARFGDRIVHAAVDISHYKAHVSK